MEGREAAESLVQHRDWAHQLDVAIGEDRLHADIAPTAVAAYWRERIRLWHEQVERTLDPYPDLLAAFRGQVPILPASHRQGWWSELVHELDERRRRLDHIIGRVKNE